MPNNTIAELSVSRETLDKLDAYEGLITKWTKKINLVSRSTLSDLRERHIVDSAQLFRLIPSKSNHLVDFGSGGGLPGVVLAILAQEHLPKLRVTLVESDLRKATFLRQCCRELDLRYAVKSVRAEALEPQEASVVTARALAPLSLLFELTFRHMSAEAVAIFPKGQNAEEELASARQSWSFDCEQYQSLTSTQSSLLRFQRIERV